MDYACKGMRIFANGGFNPPGQHNIPGEGNVNGLGTMGSLPQSTGKRISENKYSRPSYNKKQ